MTPENVKHEIMAPARTTYRLQLHAGFPLASAAAVADYLAELGVTHVYLSPVLQAAPASTHGYDVVDHSRVNDELGGTEAWRALIDRLHELGLGVLLDIVPNHMAITGRENAWWWDVLENGPSSVYASYFDVDWDPPDARLRNLVLLPVLGDRYGRVVEAGEIGVAREGGSFVVRYFDHVVPVAPRSLDDLLTDAARRCGSDDLAGIAAALGHLPHSTATDVASVEERHRDKELLRRRLADLCEHEPAVAKTIDLVVGEHNEDPDRLDRLLERQNYRLAYWRTGSQQLDYRRFFDIDELIGVRVEHGPVFDAVHERVAGWLHDGSIDGVRVDHVDGLRDPAGYLRHLAALGGGTEPWIVVEKILGRDEHLPPGWPVAGTTGYEFANLVLGLFIDPDGEAALSRTYATTTGENLAFSEVARSARREIMRTALAADADRLTAMFVKVCEQHRRARDFTRRELADALREVAASFEVYRTYVTSDVATAPTDEERIQSATAVARRRRPDLDAELLVFLGELLAGHHPGVLETEFAIRFQQFTPPVMAKGVEDTAGYRYHRLIALNEVGGDPDRFGVTVDDFHAACARAATTPGGLVATATHDTKRGEDVRARLAVLSELPDEWDAAVRDFEARGAALVSGDADVPDSNARMLFWQTLVGAWPISAGRAAAYMEKAAREAKSHTSWIDPDPRYEAGLRRWVEHVLDDVGVQMAVGAFVERIGWYGRANGLVQLALKLTVPGVADIYQGTELWDHSLVDPDNRRPVDYDERRRILAAPFLPTGSQPTGSHPKLQAMHELLALRRACPTAFGPEGSYEPLVVRGPAARHAIAFRRGGEVAVVAGRLFAVLERIGGWQDTTVDLGDGAPTAVGDLLVDRPFATARRA